MAQIITIPSRQDNYIWLIKKGSQAAVVDPGEAKPVLERLEQLGLDLVAILLTHHHYDHVDGVKPLLERFPQCRLFGPQDPQLSQFNTLIPLGEGDALSLPELSLHFEVLHLPGHTQTHIAYYGHGWLFCGDVLFGGGCGRLLGGTAEQMYHSLQRLKQLPAHTQIYCAHEYTWNNLRFCQAMDPLNPDLAARLRQTSKLRQLGLPTVPFPLATELATNCFLRTHTPGIKAAAQQIAQDDCESEIQVFAVLREKKNNF